MLMTVLAFLVTIGVLVVIHHPVGMRASLIGRDVGKGGRIALAKWPA